MSTNTGVDSFWRRCSTCKKEIAFSRQHWVCNVSTCNRGGTVFVFCSVPCWDAHVPVMRHRDSWAVEKTAPSRAEWQRHRAEQERDAARAVQPVPPRQTQQSSSATSPSSPPHLPSGPIPRDVLVVASKLKNYVRLKSGMNTSDTVFEILSDKLRELCDRAIERATQAGRKTVMERDF